MIKTDFENSKHFYQRKKCVLCNSKNIKEVLDFGKTPLANSYLKKKSYQKKYKLNCVLCENCGHLQLKTIVNPKKLFENYLYVSGTSPVLKKHFEKYCNKLISYFKLIPKTDKILDIACNDGTFLDFFKKKKFINVIGVEPAKNLRNLNLKKGIDVNTFFFNEQSSLILKKKYESFKIISANNVFAHVPDLKSFALGVKNILARDGIFVFEVSYLIDVINKLTFDTIYHEHMSYHALKPLISFFEELNMEVFDFDLIEAQGGSIRVYVGFKRFHEVQKNKIKKQIKKEEKLGIFSKKFYNIFFDRIMQHKSKLKKMLDKIKKNNNKIVGYGAPAKLTTLSYTFDLNKKYLAYIVDDNDLKQGRLTPGKFIPIKSFQKFKNDDFDYIIITAWNFAKPIKEKLFHELKGKKFKIITPFPKLELTKSV